MKYFGLILIPLFSLTIVLFPFDANAAPACSGYGGLSDPACYTSSTYHIGWECEWYDNGNNYCYETYDSSLSKPWTGSMTITSGSCPASHPHEYPWPQVSNTCGDTPTCGNMNGVHAGEGYGNEITGTTNTCHYIDSVTAWSSCNPATNSQVAAAVHWTTTGGTSCSHVPLSRYCCPDPASDVSVNSDTVGPVTVDAEDDFTVGWEFTNTDPLNGYVCEINNPHDVLLTPSPYAFNYGSSLGLLTGSLTGNIVFAGPNSTYVHNYELSCTHTEAGCPPTADNINVAVTPLPLQAWLTVNDGTSDLTDGSNAQVTDWLRFTVDVEGGVPSDVDNQYAVSWQWFVDGVPHSSHTGRTATIGSEEHTDYHDKRFGVEGATVGATVTITDLWAPAPGHTIVRTFGLTMVDDRNPQ